MSQDRSNFDAALIAESMLKIIATELMKTMTFF